MENFNILLAGFGGQGILFAGKVMAYAGLIEEKEISWLPSYGPEMRGGTANCSVCISKEPIGSPLVLSPNVLGVMNGPSYDKFIDTVEPGGIVVIDSSLILQKCERTDVSAFYVDATALADEKDLHGLANMIVLGKIIKESAFASLDAVKKSLTKCVPPKKAQLMESNIRAIELGMRL